MPKHYTHLLKTKRFLPLFLTQFLGAFNDNVFKNAMLILITFTMATQISVPSSILLALSGAIFILPFFLFSATAGQLADKYEKSRLIRFVKLCEIAAMAVGALGFYWHSIPILWFTLFMLGVHSTFFGPIKHSILPDHLQQAELLSGNALIQASTFAAILLGTVLGGNVVVWHTGEIWVSAVAISIAVLGLVCSCFIPRANIDQPDLQLSWHGWRETMAIMRYAKSHKTIFLCILGISWFWLVGAVFLSEFPDYVKYHLQAGPPIVTVLLCTFSIGIALGSILIDRIQKKKINATYVPIAVLGISFFIIDLYFASQSAGVSQGTDVLGFLANLYNWRILFDLGMTAFCGGMFCVPLYTIMQYHAEASHRSRVIAANNIINALFMVTGGILTALLAALHLSVLKIFCLIGLVNLAIAIYICGLLPEALIKSAVRWVLSIIYRVEVVGLDNYERAGSRTVIVGNHSSFLDAILLSAFLPDKMLFAVNTHIARAWWVKPALKFVDAFPLDPTKPMSLKSLIKRIQNNQRCLIFPEGRLTVTGALMKIYEGPGSVADKADAKLLPIRIDGAQYSPFTRLRGKVKTQWFPKITLTILPERVWVMPDTLKGRARRRVISAKLYDLMTELMFDSSDYEKTLFASLVEASKVAHWRHKAIEDTQRRPLSYCALLIKTWVLGDYIAAHSQAGEYIGLLLPNVIATAVSFFACQAYSRVPAMLNYSTGSQQILNACITAKLRQVYTSRRFIEALKLEGLLDKLTGQQIQITYLEDLAGKIRIKQKLLGVLRAFYSEWAYKRNNPQAHCEQPAVVLFTSGSEGTPKGVVLSHKNIQANLYQLASRIDFNPQDSIFNALPVFHSFGLTGGMVLPLLSGIKTFFYPSPLHYRIVPELVYDTNSTLMFGTDTFLAGYARGAHPYDFYSVRYVFAGAEKLKPSTRDKWIEKFGVRIFEGYGTTETSPALAINTPMQNKTGTVGRFLPKILVKLEPVPGIETGGQLFVAGPNVMLGYLKQDLPGVIQAPPEGWYDTGDIVEIDEEGYVRILGRVKRFAKIAGEMISLTAIEEMINQCRPGFLHAVVGVADERKGEQLIWVTDDPQAECGALRECFREKGFAEIQVPRKVVLLKKMLLLGTGKIDYVAIANYLYAQKFAAVEVEH